MTRTVQGHEKLYAIFNDMKYSSIFFLLCLALGCGQTETREVRETFNNGNPEIIYFYQDPKDTLTYRKEVFYESGKQNYVGHLIKGRKEGVWTWWYESGNKKDQCKYFNGKEIDTIFHWYENGKLERIDIPEKGETNLNNSCTFCCNMRSTIYYESGQQKQTFTRLDNLDQDTTRFWYENGQLESITVWKDGVQNGLFREYYSNGQMKADAIFIDGWEDGKVTQWDSLGNVVKVSYWKDKQLIKEN